MKRRLWVAAALAPLTFAAAAHAAVPTPISTATSTPVSTSATGDLTISGSIGVTQTVTGTAAAHPTTYTPPVVTVVGLTQTVTSANGVQTTTNGPALVTVDSANSVTNSGSLLSNETTSYSDTNGDGIADTNTSGGVSVLGQLAVGANRYGINVIDSVVGATIANSGSIAVVGENSAGILIGAGGLSGALTNSGSISAVGGNFGSPLDVSYGIHAIGAIQGLVSLTGTVTASGQNATAVALDGGALGVTVSSSVTASGYRSTTAPTYVGYNLLIYTPWLDPKLTTAQIASFETITKAELMQGGPAMSVGGMTSGGINITAADSTTVDPTTKLAVTQGTIASYGSAPALLIGGAGPITIGAVTNGISTNFGNGNDADLQIAGTVRGAGSFYNVNGTAIQIGGSNPLAVASGGVASGGAFGTVSLTSPTSGTNPLAGGITITGAVSGSAQGEDIAASIPGRGPTVAAVSSNVSATGLYIGTGATVSSINVLSVKTVSGSTTYNSAGSLTAVVSADAPTGSPTATALKIDTGASVGSITNTGVIAAVVQGLTTVGSNRATTVSGGTNGTAIAISDQSAGAVTVNNSGTITAAVVPPLGALVDKTKTTTVAMDFSGNTGGVTVTQTASVIVDTLTEQLITPSIIGDIKFGSGAASLDLEAGAVLGKVSYGASANNHLIVNNGATLTGAITTTPVGSAVNLQINDGHVYDESTAQITSSGLTIGAKGSIVLNADPSPPPVGGIPGTPSAGSIVLTSGATANLASGASIGLNFLSELTSPETYVLVQTDAGKLTIGSIDTTLNGVLPYLYSGVVSKVSTGANDQLTLAVAQKTAAQLGLNPGETQAYGAIYAAVSTDTAVQAAMLGKTDRAGFLKFYDQFLPDYQGGSFEALVNGQQAIARTEAEQPIKLQEDETHGWVEEIGFDNHRGDSSGGGHDGYNGHGFGMVAGVESVKHGNAVGATISFLSTNMDDSSQTSNGSILAASALEAGVYWRAASGGFNLTASANGGMAFFNSKRQVYDASPSVADAAAIAAGTTTSLTGSGNYAASSTTALYRQAESNWSGGLASAAVLASYQFDFGRLYVRPEVEADYAVLFESKHTESGGGAAVDLAINARTNTQASARVDAVFGASFGTTIVWRPELTIGWKSVVTGGPANTNARFTNADSTSFTLSPNFNDKGGLLARLGLRAGSSYADFSADAGGEFSSGYQTYDARAVARFLF